MNEGNNRTNIIWTAGFAYGIGLITSDGNLSKDGRHISFKSAELELINNFKNAFGIDNRIGRSARGGEIEKRYYYTQFSNVRLYAYLNTIGLTSGKSKTIKKVEVPKKYFHDFLRGVFDGDGTFYTFWDRRWIQSFGFQISFASASLDFIVWLKDTLHQLFGVKGFIRVGDGVYNLRYVKRDTRVLFGQMYRNENCKLFLKRKYDKMKDAFNLDDALKQKRVSRSNEAAVAHW